MNTPGTSIVGGMKLITGVNSKDGCGVWVSFGFWIHHSQFLGLLVSEMS